MTRAKTVAAEVLYTLSLASFYFLLASLLGLGLDDPLHDEVALGSSCDELGQR